MSKKVKFKIKRGKMKVKLKSGDDVLPLSEGDIRGLLVLGMASAIGPGASGEPGLLTTGGDEPSKPLAGDFAEQDPNGNAESSS